MSGEVTFRLEGVVRERGSLEDFEGPLSLILQLLGRNKIEIRDISVAEILDQYLAYLDEMQRMDLEIASEFVQMAAYLLYIKTKTLLASDREVTELEELMSSLEQLKAKGARERIKAVLPQFSEMSGNGAGLFTRSQEPLSREAKGLRLPPRPGGAALGAAGRVPAARYPPARAAGDGAPRAEAHSLRA